MKKQIEYRKIAKALVKKEAENIVKTITSGQSPNLHWDLEVAIVDALKYVAKTVEQETKLDFFDYIKEFDKNDGNTTN